MPDEGGEQTQEDRVLVQLGAWCGALLILNEPGGVTIDTLAEEMGIDRVRVSAAVERLRRRALVTLERILELVRPTDEGLLRAYELDPNLESEVEAEAQERRGRPITATQPVAKIQFHLGPGYSTDPATTLQLHATTVSGDAEAFTRAVKRRSALLPLLLVFEVLGRRNIGAPTSRIASAVDELARRGLPIT